MRPYYVLQSAIIFLIIFSPATAFCQLGQVGEPYLTYSPDARGKGLGEGGSVYSTGAISAYYNPANLVTSGIASAEISYYKMLPSLADDISYKNIYLSRVFGDGWYLGLNYNRLGLGDQVRYDETGHAFGQYSSYEFVLGINSAIELDSNTSVGVGAKYIKSHFAYESEAATFAIDFGILSKNHFPNLTFSSGKINYPTLRRYCRSRNDKGVAVGLSVANLGPDIKYDYVNASDPLPRRLRIAGGYQVVDNDEFGMRFTIDAAKLLVNNSDGFSTEWDEIAWSYGLETNFFYLVSLRTGRLLDRASYQRYWTWGIGVGPEWLHLDYGRVINSDENWNRKSGEYTVSLYCNLKPGLFKPDK